MDNVTVYSQGTSEESALVSAHTSPRKRVLTGKSSQSTSKIPKEKTRTSKNRPSDATPKEIIGSEREVRTKQNFLLQSSIKYDMYSLKLNMISVNKIEIIFII